MIRVASRRCIVLCVCLLSVAAGSAHAEWDVDHIEKLLPRGETRAEHAWREARILAGEPLHRSVVADPPPLAPIRGSAEWEPVTGVLVRYPLGLPYALLRDMDDDVTLHVIVSSSLLSTAQTNLSANGVDMSQVEFLVEPNNSIWTRDYGPWFIFDGNGDFHIVDHVYNRPQRPDDDLIPVAFGAQQSISVVRHDMWHTGGNYMTDGATLSSSTDLVYDEAAVANGMTPAEVDALMLDYYGVTGYRVVEDIEVGGIHHIDTWGKLLDEETVLVKEVWPGHYTYDDLEQRATLLASLQASTGRPYTVARVYCHDIGGNRPASYTNSLILNTNVYVPTFGSPANDAAALSAYESAMPGYIVRGYAYGGWLTDDALHCRAKGVMDGGMLHVAHVPVREPRIGEVTIEATIRDYSSSGIAAADLAYRQAGGAWQTIPMTTEGQSLYTGTIPVPASLTVTDYYVHAEDGEGRSSGMPRPEPVAWYSFTHGVTTVSVGETSGTLGDRLDATLVNPFRSRTTLSFELRSADRVELSVYDVRGRRVRMLVDDTLPEGRAEIVWDGRDAAGRDAAPGVYRMVLRTAGLVYAKPVVKVE